MEEGDGFDAGRRTFLLAAGVGMATLGGGAVAAGFTGEEGSDALSTLLQTHYRRMSPEEIAAALRRIERKAQREYQADLTCHNTPPIPGVRFGHALNLSRCRGTRRCVEACTDENNCHRGGTTQNIRVLSLPQGEQTLTRGDLYYAPATVPEPGRWYLPVSCQHCADPPCVQACPVGATWTEPDGIVVVDYDWCLGCRYCAVACPYGARHFNWETPRLTAAEITPETHYLSNRPRPRGVMEKCTWCLQRVRTGRLPACHEACPTGARLFGDLTDETSEIRWILANKPVFRLKESLSTNPRFWYFTDGRG